MPEIWQFFVEPFHPARGAETIRGACGSVEKQRGIALANRDAYFCSLSRTIVYKGRYDLQFPGVRRFARSSFATTFAVFNTLFNEPQPSWHLAQPLRLRRRINGDQYDVSNRQRACAKAAETRSRLTVGRGSPSYEENVSIGEVRQRFRAAAPRGLSWKEDCRHGSSGLQKRSPAFAGRRGALDRASQQSEPGMAPRLWFLEARFVGSASWTAMAMRPMRTRAYDMRPADCRVRGPVWSTWKESRIAERQRLGPWRSSFASDKLPYEKTRAAGASRVRFAAKAAGTAPPRTSRAKSRGYF